MKLHVINGRPCIFKEAAEVDAVFQAESRMSSQRRGDVRMVDSAKKNLTENQQELKEAQKEAGRRMPGRRSFQDVTCYGCGKKGHYCRDYPHNKGGSQGKNSSG